MTKPTTITLSFPDGLAPQVYADIHAVAEGHRTSSERGLLSALENCSGALNRLAIELGVPVQAVVEHLHSDGHDGDNYMAVVEAAMRQVKANSTSSDVVYRRLWDCLDEAGVSRAEAAGLWPI